MATGRVTPARMVAAVVVAALLATGCTPSDPEPAPSPTPSPTAAAGPVPETGDRIAVIVPPAGIVAPAEGAALLRAARDLAASAPAGVAEIRIVEATSGAFVRDLAELAVDDGFDVVCVVGTGSAELALDLARARREVRFCTTDSRITGGPVNLVAVGLDPTMLVQSGAIAIGTAPAPVGLLLSPQIGDVEALTATFTSSVAPPTQPAAPPVAASPTPAPSPTPLPGPTPSPSPPGPTSPQPPFVTAAPGSTASAQVTAGEELAAQRPSSALVLATPGGVGAADAVAVNGSLLVAVSDWVVDAEGEPPANLLVGLTVDWGRLLRAAVAAARSEDAPQVELIGAPALGALAGQAQGAAAAAERTTAFLQQDQN